MRKKFNQGVGGSIPALVDVSLSKALNPELFPIAVSTGYEHVKFLCVLKKALYKLNGLL